MIYILVHILLYHYIICNMYFCMFLKLNIFKYYVYIHVYRIKHKYITSYNDKRKYKHG